jgi:sucrose-6-phosphate hydrolase SacC (GH32 family)
VDFCIVRRDDTYHLFHIAHVAGNDYNAPCHTGWLGHAVSKDLDTWKILNPCLHARHDIYYESAHVWAPFVVEGKGRHFMFYAGVTLEPSQTICGAVSTDPELEKWERCAGNPITPLSGFDWHWRNPRGHARHARDPHVARIGDLYLLVYTALHKGGCGAVGGLVSSDLTRWEDIGPLLYRPSRTAPWLPESVNLQPLPDGKWALIPSVAPGLEYYLSESPFHFHDIDPTPIEYENGDREKVYALEVIHRNDENNLWLVAYFESDEFRLRLGVLNCRKHPWSIRKAADPSEMEGWLA